MKKYLLVVIIFSIANLFSALTLLSPNSNEPFKRGQNVEIRWIDNLPEKVKIELFKDEVFFSTISDSTESDSLYAWSVPADIYGDNFRIKISSVLTPETENDISDRFFDILPGVIANVTPDAHNVLRKGDRFEIFWVDDIQEDVKIELFQNNILIEEIISNTESNGYYSYTFPPFYSGSGYKIKLSSVTVPEIVYAWSEGDISIVNDYIKKVSPRVNEVIPRGNGGMGYDIFWEQNDLNMCEKKIELYRNGNFIETVADWGMVMKNDNKMTNMFSYNFPYQLSGTGYKFKISARMSDGLGGYEYLDVAWSEGEISIMSDYLKRVSPYVNEIIPRGNGGMGYEIYWEQNDFNIYEKKIDLYQNDNFIETVADWGWIMKNEDNKTANMFSYNFPYQLSGTGYKFKISARLPDGFGAYEYLDAAWSEGEITIESDYIKRVTPRVNEVLSRGNESVNYNIFWEQNGFNICEKKIELYQNGNFIETVADWGEVWKNSDSKMMGMWTYNFPPDYYGTGYKFKISSRMSDGLGGYEYLNAAWSEGELTITKGFITDVSPKNGDLLFSGAQIDIAWVDNIDEPVNVDLYQNGLLLQNIGSWVESSGIYSTTLPPELYGDKFKIKVSSVFLPSEVYSVSEGEFQILQEQIQLTSKLGSKSVPMESQFDITWEDNILEDVVLELYQNGTYYSDIVFTPSNGLYNWSLPTGITGDNYQIKISSVTDPLVNDISGNFSIDSASVILTSFNGGEIINGGQICDITWVSNITEDIQIDLYQNDVYFGNIATTQSVTGSYQSVVPNDLYGDDFKVKISSVSNPETINDISSGEISIYPSFIEQVTPVRNVQVLYDSQYEINWIDNIPEDVMIELCDEFGTPVQMITGVTESDGSYIWDPVIFPNEDPSISYKFKISSVSTPEIHSFSSSTISVKPYYISNVTPSSNIELSPYPDPNQKVEITWDSNIASDFFTEIVLCDDEMPICYIGGTNNTGYFLWNNIDTSILVPGRKYSIKVFMGLPNGEINSYSTGEIAVKPYYISNVTPSTNILLSPDSDFSQRVEITWNSNLELSSNVTLELADENGMPIFFIDNVQNTGCYIWENAWYPYDPNNPDKKYRIRIWKSIDTGYGYEDIFSYSVGEVSVEPYYISNVTPSSNIELSLYPDPNQKMEVMWDSNASSDWLTEIVFCEDEMPVCTIGSTNNTGYYLCENIDTSVLDPDKKYRVKVLMSLPDGETNSFSTGEISVKAPILNSVKPVNNDYIFAGDSYHITWSDNFSDSVKIELYENDIFHSEITSSTASDGSYIWQTPDSLEGSDFKIKVTSLGLGPIQEISSFSPGNLIMIDGQLMTVAPNGGEVVDQGEEFEILWYDEINGLVDIQLYESGYFHSSIAESIESSGKYLWTIPSDISGELFQIRIVSVNIPELNDISDGYFEIKAGLPEAPTNVTTTVVSGILKIDWDDMPNANSYLLYASDDPYGEFTLESIVTTSVWSGTIDSNTKKFYYILSSNESFKNTRENEKININKIEDVLR